MLTPCFRQKSLSKGGKALMRWRILNIEPLGYSVEARSILAQLGDVEEDQMSRAQLLQKLNAYDVLIVRLAHQIDSEVLEAGTALKAIVTATTGLDHIDVAEAQARGIAVLSLQGETDFLQGITATAEHTWALLLALVRRIVPASVAAQSGNWNRDQFRGHQLKGKRLGIVGLGRLGRMVAGYGQAFDMEVSAFDPFVQDWLPGVRQSPSLQDLIGWSNVLSLHVPLTTETRGLIGFTELQQMVAGAYLINTSRGQLIDEEALVQSLESGHLAGAALDVVIAERDPEQRSTSLLLAYAAKFENLLITPHIAGATHESMARTEMFMAWKLAKFLHHKTSGQALE
jgi:D-3-phosphoglycerate dehydrogenase